MSKGFLLVMMRQTAEPQMFVHIRLDHSRDISVGQRFYERKQNFVENFNIDHYFFWVDFAGLFPFEQIGYHYCKRLSLLAPVVGRFITCFFVFLLLRI